MDGCIISSPEKESGKIAWTEKMKQPFPHIGWWSKPESLDLSVFDIKAYPKILTLLNKNVSTPNTYVVIMTSRMEKLRPEVEKVLKHINVNVDKLDMKYNEKTKGQKLLNYVKQFPDLVEINVYDDNYDVIASYQDIKNQIPENITFNIYRADQGEISLVDSNYRLTDIIREELQNF